MLAAESDSPAEANGVASLATARAAIASCILDDEPEQLRIGDITLHPHQCSAVARIRRTIHARGGALLCDRVGLGKTYVALVNTNPHDATDVVLNVAGQNVGAVRGQLLTADAMDAHNTFEHKDAVKPVPFSANANGGKLTIKVPAKSVLVVAVEG